MFTHRRWIVAAATVVVVAALAGPSALAAQSIRGKLLEQVTERPVAGATVVLLTERGTQAGQGARTDSAGAFLLRAPAPGAYRLRAERAGYRPAVSPAVELRDDDEVGLTLHLQADTISLSPVVVTAHNHRPPGRLGGFYDRSRVAAFGRFVTHEQIERARPFVVTDLLRTMPGLQVVPARVGGGSVVRTTEGCTPMVYLDGLRFPLFRGESIDFLVQPMELEGVEVYAHATEVPVEFQGARSRCGAILLWTRASQ